MCPSCDCSVDDYDVPRVSTIKFPRARRAYCCIECNEQIATGERYEHVRGIWHSRWESFKTCLPCTRIREDFCPGGHVFGELASAVGECLGFDYRTAGGEG